MAVTGRYVVRGVTGAGVEVPLAEVWLELAGAVAAARALVEVGIYRRVLAAWLEDESEVLVIVWDSRRND